MSAIHRLIQRVIGISLLLGVASTQASADENTSLYWMQLSGNTKEIRTKISNTGVAIDTVLHGKVYANGSLEELEKLEAMGLVEESFELNQDTLDFPKKDEKFHNYDELLQVMHTIGTNFPDLVKIEPIGRSLEGRIIYNMQITSQPNNMNVPGIVFMGGHHAREHLSVELPLAVAKYLVVEYRKGNPRIRRLLDGRIINIIPVVNPDGKEHDIAEGRYKMWRKNRSTNADGSRGVDLNRNYGYKWGGQGSSGSPSSQTYRGPAPFSEPETQAVKQFVETRPNLSTVISFHTYSELILYPWGHTYDSISDERDRAVHEVMARQMAQWNGYKPQQGSDLYIVSGDTTDWAYGAHRMVTFTFELDPKSQWSGGFYPGQAYIERVFQKNLEPCLYLIEYSDNPYRVLQPFQAGYGLQSPILQ